MRSLSRFGGATVKAHIRTLTHIGRSPLFAFGGDSEVEPKQVCSEPRGTSSAQVFSKCLRKHGLGVVMLRRSRKFKTIQTLSS